MQWWCDLSDNQRGNIINQAHQYVKKTSTEVHKMDTTQFAEGQWINAELIKKSPSKKMYISGDAKIVAGKFGDKLEVPVEIDDKPKTWTVTRDQVKALHTAYGKDSKLWVGKNVNMKVVDVNNKETVIVEPILDVVQELVEDAPKETPQ